MSTLDVLALNSGSSSLKFGVYRVGAAGTETLLADSVDGVDPRQAVGQVLHALAQAKLPPPGAIGHRIVHGGPLLRRHAVIDDALLRQLEGAAAFAPLHTPAALSVIRLATEHFAGTPQVACLDTSFHASMPDVARVLPIAREWQAQGLQRYGFHGLSLESIVRQLGSALPRRLVVAHLGNGCSVTAIDAGRSVDTSMGLTPTGGVIMGTRSGDLDPGVLVYLAREQGFDAARLEALVDRSAGLLGISGASSDMRQLHAAAAAGNANARLAIDMFCYSVRKQVASMAAALGGIDLLVFTGGIGENDAAVRTMVCAGLAHIGIGVGTAGTGCAVRVVAAQEDEQISRHAWALLRSAAG